jgi:hypothetical protein
MKVKLDNDKSKIGLAAKGLSVDSYGVALNIKIKVCNKNIKTNFVIMDSEYDVVLGLPWFESANACLLFTKDHKRILKFDDTPGKSYHINTIGKSDESQEINTEPVENVTELETLDPPDDEMETLLDDHWNFSPDCVKIKTSTPLTKEQQLIFNKEIVIAKSIVGVGPD